MGLVYVYIMVPEVAGLSVEEIDQVFEGSWLNAWRTTRRRNRPGLSVEIIDGQIGQVEGEGSR